MTPDGPLEIYLDQVCACGVRQQPINCRYEAVSEHGVNVIGTCPACGAPVKFRARDLSTFDSYPDA